MKYIAGQTAQSGLNANHIRSDNSDCSILHTRIESLEQALHLSEDKFNSFFKKSKTPLFITDSDCRFVEFNQAMIDMLEYAEKEISALKIADIIDNPDDYHHFQRKIIHNGHICGYKAKLRKNSGDYVDCTITADIKIDAFGFFAGLQGSINDITSQKHIEQKLARRDELQKLIMLTSTEFLRLMTDEIDTGIQNALKSIAQYTGADSCYVFLMSRDGKSMQCSHEWYAAVPNELRSDIHEIPSGQLMIIKKLLDTAGIMTIKDVDTLAGEYYFLKRLCLAKGIQSIGGIPIVSGDKTMGCIVIASRHSNLTWTDNEIALIKIIGEIFAISLERRRAEQALRESEARFRALIDQAEDSIVVHDLEGNIVVANNKEAELLGISKEKIESSNVADISPIVMKDKHRTRYWEKLTPGKSVNFDRIVNRPDGSTIPVEVKLWRLTLEGKPVIMSIARDISERKKAEEALRESEGRFRALIDQASDGIIVHDINGKIFVVNEYECTLVGYSRDELFASGMARILSSDVLEEHKNKYWRKLRFGKNIHFENDTSRRDGSTFPVEVTLSKINFNGSPAIMSITHDITERKQAEEALRASEKKYRTLFENLQEGIMITDVEGTIVFVNDIFAEMLGYNTEEYIGRKPYEFAEEGHNDIVKNHMSEQRKGLAGHYLSKYKHKDGHIVYTTVHAGPIFDTAGKYGGDIVCYSDITERIKAEHERELLLKDIQEINKKLEQSNKELQDFAYIASHDLREPMRKISSFGLLLKESLKDKLDEDQQENFDFMIDGANRMQSMIEDLLTYSRLTTKAKPFNKVDINEIIHNLNKVDLAARLAETGGTINVPQPLPPVYGDPIQIHQLFLNLVNNSLKFHRKGIAPIVTIRVKNNDGNTLKIEVEDNGIGIPPEYHKQIFTMFKRLHSRTEYEGTGIGLAICSKIVSRHGGEIVVTSTPGAGSIFTFTLRRGNSQ